MSGPDTFKLLVFIFLVIIVFLICREIVLWYFKINERVKLQKEISANIKELVKLQGGTPFNLKEEKEPWWKEPKKEEGKS